jgi:xanthine dehydrogenase accessory factor
MSDQTFILVLGVGPLASATARLLLLAGYAVALQQREPPKVLRRRMSFADAWRQGKATLDGVEARLARSDAQFLAGLRQKSFVPLLATPFAHAAERWPWDVIVDARSEGVDREEILFDAPLRIKLGAGAVAGENCDLAIAVEGPDPGAVIREGAIKIPAHAPQDRSFRERGRIAAPESGFFTTAKDIGVLVAGGETLGSVGGRPAPAPFAGRLIGLLEVGAAVATGEEVAEVCMNVSEPWAGVARGDQAIARAVLLAMQMELNGWAPVEFEGLV